MASEAARNSRVAPISPLSAPKPKPSARSSGPSTDVRVRRPSAAAIILPATNTTRKINANASTAAPAAVPTTPASIAATGA